MSDASPHPIPFHVPFLAGNEERYLREALDRRELTGDAHFVTRARRMIEEQTGAHAALLVPSCTHALELAAVLADVGPGDEVVMPSFGFTSTANAFVLRGATPVFVDVRADTMNVDEACIEDAITDRTRAIVVIHYGGVACAMDAISEIASRRGVMLIEDAAQGVSASLDGRALGTLGALGCFSYHATKSIGCGEGGALLVNDEALVGRSEIVREKGTNRAAFFRGDVDKYRWVDVGSAWVMDELRGAVLVAQLERAEEVARDRRATAARYADLLAPLRDRGHLELMHVPEGCHPNGHLYWIKARDLDERGRLIAHLAADGIGARFHFVPLHDAPAGARFGRFHGVDRVTTRDSERLLRLPLRFEMPEAEVVRVVERIASFYG